MINIEASRNGNIRTLSLRGKVVSASQDKLWRTVQHEVVELGERELILNFADVAECDSYGISELLRLHRSIENIGGRMVIACLNDLITKVFAITKVDTVFKVAATMPEAIAMFPSSDLEKVSS